MSLSEVLDTVTRVPARLVHRESLASMAPGTEADLVIFKVKEKRYLTATVPVTPSPVIR
ncbi:MAG: hypothetical protein ACLUD2_03535 [Clostridium sp.]